jgi:hypothetical protein
MPSSIDKQPLATPRTLTQGFGHCRRAQWTDAHRHSDAFGQAVSF